MLYGRSLPFVIAKCEADSGRRSHAGSAETMKWIGEHFCGRREYTHVCVCICVCMSRGGGCERETGWDVRTTRGVRRAKQGGMGGDLDTKDREKKKREEEGDIKHGMYVCGASYVNYTIFTIGFIFKLIFTKKMRLYGTSPSIDST